MSAPNDDVRASLEERLGPHVIAKLKSMAWQHATFDRGQFGFYTDPARNATPVRTGRVPRASRRKVVAGVDKDGNIVTAWAHIPKGGTYSARTKDNSKFTVPEPYWKAMAPRHDTSSASAAEGRAHGPTSVGRPGDGLSDGTAGSRLDGAAPSNTQGVGDRQSLLESEHRAGNSLGASPALRKYSGDSDESSSEQQSVDYNSDSSSEPHDEVALPSTDIYSKETLEQPMPDAIPDKPSSTVNLSMLNAALRQGTSKLQSVRLMVLGASRRGKTSTVASLQRKPFVEGRESTETVELDICFLVPGLDKVGVHQEEVLRVRDTFRKQFQQFSKQDSDATESHPSEALLRRSTNGEEVVEEDAAGIDAIEAVQWPEIDGQHDELSRDFDAEDLVSAADEPEEEVSDGSITLRVWDFGGQHEYFAAQELFISSRSIIMLVFDLERFESSETRDHEVKMLVRWLQTITALTPEEEVGRTSLLIVGTRRDGCEHRDKVSKYCEQLRRMLLSAVDENACRLWNLRQLAVLAIENKNAIVRVEESGLGRLEEVLMSLTLQVIERSPEIPLRWLAFLESARKNPNVKNRMFVRQAQLEDEMNGFKFPLDGNRRGEELKELLTYFRELGEVLLFRSGSENLPGSTAVFLYPQKIVDALKVIIAPVYVRCGGPLSGREISLMKAGLLNESILKKKWESYAGLELKEERKVVADLLTSVDILVRLRETDERHDGASFEEPICQSATLAVPSLLPFGWKGWKWLEGSADRREVSAVTVFKTFVPLGLIGTLAARLSRRVGQKPADVRFVRSNAVLLTLDQQVSGHSATQVFAGFRFEDRELHWVVRAEDYDFELLERCLKEFEGLLEERLRVKRGSREEHGHFFIGRCPTGCSDLDFRLTFPMPNDFVSNVRARRSWRSSNPVSLSEVSKACGESLCENDNCSRVWSLETALQKCESSQVPGSNPGNKPKKYVVFVSHAGEDKDWAVYLTRALESRGLRTFVDRLELQGDRKTADDRMLEAMQQAVVAVFILSPEFYAKKWTLFELTTLIDRKASASDGGENLILFPIFFRLPHSQASRNDLHECPKMSPVLARKGFYNIRRQQELPTTKIVKAFGELCRFSGLETGDKDMHSKAWWSNPVLYNARLLLSRLQRSSGLFGTETQLTGMSEAQFFDCAAERIWVTYKRPCSGTQDAQGPCG